MSMTALTRQDIESVVAAAVAAPSVLNTQPWLFDAHGDVIDLYGDPVRSLPVTDPEQRALCVSCGAALLNLRLAIGELRRQPLAELLPTAGHDLHLARVSIGSSYEPVLEERVQHAAIPRRRTSRSPVALEPIPVDTLADLARQAEVEGAFLHVLGAQETRDIIELTHEADRAQRFDAGARAELLSWVDRPMESRDGIPAGSLGPRPRDPGAAVRDFAMGSPVRDRESADFERTPTLAVLLTVGDGRRDWLQAGQALQRVLLAATAAGLATSLLTQAAEVAALRDLLRSPKLGPMHPHAIIRLGYGPRGPASPRRPVSEVLTIHE